MPGCIDSFEPELSGWFFVAPSPDGVQSEHPPTLLLTLNGQTLLSFQPRLPRPDVDRAHGRNCGAVGFRLPVASLLVRYQREARIAGLPLNLEVVCPTHPNEPIDQQRCRLLEQRQPATTPSLESKAVCAHFYTINFFDPAGNSVYSGGAERYITDLAKLLNERYGLPSVIYQAAHYAWQRHYRGLQVIGLPCLDLSYRGVSRSFRRTPTAAVHLYSPVALACAGAHHPAIGISHGSYWDTESTSLSREETIRADLLDGLEQVDRFVSVDANSLTSLQAHRGLISRKQLERIDRKTSIVLNYADASFATAAERSFQFSADHPCRVIYARRLYAARGFDLVVQAAPELFRRCPHLQLTFCGGTEPEARAPLLELQRRFPGRVEHRELLPEQMPEAYADQHLSLVPTVNSEGSSLSALESMASGCVVVASYTGGLANIVVDGYNGILIPPTAAALVGAIISLYRNPEHCANLSQRGQQLAAALNLQTWRQRWQHCLEQLQPPLKPQTPQLCPPAETSISILHPLVEGIGLADGMPGMLPPQRPQALFDLLERMGLPTRFCAADRLLNSGERICSRQYTCYDDVCLVYVYKPLLYAFLIPELRQQLPQLFADDSELIGQRVYGLTAAGSSPWSYLQEQADRIRPGRMQLWFDWLDAMELECDEHGVVGRYVAVVYEQFMREASLFTASSPTLQREAATRVQRKPLLLPNATLSRYSPALQESARSAGAVQAALQATAGYRWRLAYWGTADPRVLDLELIAVLASQMPAAAFLLVGTGPWPSSTLPANVVVLPRMEHAQLWQLARHCQAGLLPFHDHPITAAVDPLKWHEYLEAGLPVVATDITSWRELRASYGWPVPVHLCGSSDAWLQTLEHILSSAEQHDPPTRGRFWSDQAAPLSAQLRTILPKRSQPHFVQFDPQGLRITPDPLDVHITQQLHRPRSSLLIIDLRASSNGRTEQQLQLQLPLYSSSSGQILTISALTPTREIVQLELLDSENSPLPHSNSTSNLGATINRWEHLDPCHDVLVLRVRLRNSAQANGEPEARQHSTNALQLCASLN
jgi:glycosyltransferase involved in cell wall biosynthesis